MAALLATGTVETASGANFVTRSGDCPEPPAKQIKLSKASRDKNQELFLDFMKNVCVHTQTF